MTRQARWGDFPDRAIEKSLTPRQLGGDLVDLSVLWRNRYRIAAAMLVGGIVAYLILSQVTPTYQATAQIVVEAGESQVIDIANVAPDATASEAFVLSEVAVFKTSPMLQALVRDLELQYDPEFNPMLQEPSLLQHVRWFFSSLFSESGEGGEIDPVVMTAYGVSPNVDARAVTGTFIIDVSAWSHSPYKAAEIANALSRLYINNQLNNKFAASERANAWLQKRVDKLREELMVAEQKVEEVKAESALQGRMSGEVIQNLIGELSVQLIEARRRYTTVNSQYEQYKKLIADENFLAASELSSSALIEEYRRRHANVTSEIESFESRFGDDYAGTKQLIALRDDIERSIENEVEKIGAGLRAGVEIAQAEVDTLSRELNEAESALAETGTSGISLRELEREAEALRAVYQQFLVRLKEARERGGFQDADARIIAPAEVPGAPVEPRKTLMTLIAVASSGLLAVIGFLVADGWRSVLVSEEDVRRCCGLPVLANVPLAKDAGSALEVVRWMAARPHSALAEALRWLRISIDTKRPKRTQTLLVTSALPREGKSTLCLMLAQVGTAEAEKTLLIDADLRRQSVSKSLGVEEPGIHPAEGFGFDVLKLAQVRDDQTAVFSGAEFFERLTAARGEYDTIIIDAPPALSLSEVALMAQSADAVVLASQWNKTPGGALARTVRQLESLGATLTGVVLTMVDLQRQAEMGYNGAEYVLRQTMTYYSDETPAKETPVDNPGAER